MVVVETAKALVDVPSPYAGTVKAVYAAPGELAAVGARLIEITVTDPADAGPPSPVPEQAAGGSVFGNGGPAPARRRGRSTTLARPAQAAPEPAPVPAPAPVPEQQPQVASPLVRQLAHRNGVDLRAVRGSGADGVILRSDVALAIGPEPAGTTRIPLRGPRATAATRFSLSRREIPDATCWVDADATALLEARARLNAGEDEPVGLLALFGRICVAALARYPGLNSLVDTERQEIVQSSAVHLGVAMQGGRGLVVPVVRDAHELTTRRLSAELARLTSAARESRLTPAELTGGSFTVNNYGVFGVDGGAPIINHPEAGMLGIGRITDKPWVHNGNLAVRKVATLSFTFDHRVCDGEYAAGFLRFVADRVEDPARLLLDL
jgi:pyruvate dehydrogenase E2 component (dihydrolipoamide acetyltransferase)